MLVIARNRVFLCILLCCMAFERLFVAFLEAELGNHPLEVAGEVQKILYRNRCGVRLGAHNAPDGEEAHNLFWACEQIAPLVAYVQEDPTRCGAANIAVHFVLADSGSAAPFVLTCCCCVSETLPRGVGVALFVVPARGL